MDSLGLSKEDFKYLSQFKNLTEALEDQSARTFLKKAGIKAADRDALVPTVGNRRLFSQSKDPRVKFLGSFLSWAQAKSSQTNALLARVEQGDAALFLRIAASMPLYYTIREAQIRLSSNKKYKESVDEETRLQKFGETMAFSGYGNLWVEKGRNMAKFDSSFFESVAPVVGFIEDVSEIGRKPLELVTNDEAETFLEGLGEVTKEISEVIPVVREFAPLLESEEPENTLSELKSRYSTGGLVKGKDDVPYTKEDAADRINKYTGKPYSDQMNRLGLADGGGDMTRVDGTQKSSQGWLGPIKNNVTGKDMTEVSMGIGPEDNQKLIPLLVPTLTKKEIEILKNMKIEGNIKNIPQSVKEKAIQHARKREEQGLNILYNGE
jgi:hypothetical protein